MSYAEPGEGSDVFVYRTSPKTIVCNWANRESYEAKSEIEMIEHLYSHRRRGHLVPERALEHLWAEHYHRPYETDVQRSLRALKGIPEDVGTTMPGAGVQRDA